MKKSTEQIVKTKSKRRHHILLMEAAPIKITTWLIAALLFAFLPFGASATAISFTPSFVGGNQWVYDYTVAAGAGDPSIDEFTVWFDQTFYGNLAVAASPSGWDSLVVQPDSTIPADGFFDSLAMATGISPGFSRGRFSVSFDFLGAGTPGAQRFDIVDPNTFATLGTGFTSPISAVPEPNTWALLCLGLALLPIFRNRFPQINRN